MFLYLFFLVGFGYSEKSVLIFGGDFHKTTLSLEQFFPSNMSTVEITTREPPKYLDTHETNWAQATPINATHAFILHDKTGVSSYIDKTGILTPGPTFSPRHGAALAALPGKNGQMIPIFCGGKQWNGKGEESFDSLDCQVMSVDGQRFKKHSTMLENYVWAALSTFGDTLIAIGGKSHQGSSTTERYDDGGQWRSVQAPPVNRKGCALVKLNETSLLTCGNHGNLRKCFIYHVDKDTWTETPDMESSGHHAEMVLIGQTVYAFGGSSGYKIQSLDISAGVESAQWRIEKGVALKKQRTFFSAWVIDSRNEPVTSRWSAVSVIVLILLLSIAIVLLYIIIGVLYRRFVVGARGIELLPNHSFWLKIYRRTHDFWATRITRQIPASVENQNYDRFEMSG